MFRSLAQRVHTVAHSARGHVLMAPLAMPVRHASGKTVKVVLIQDVPKLGSAGEKVAVAPGYARNCLIPRKQAMYAIPKNIEVVKSVFGEIKESGSGFEEVLTEFSPTGYPVYDAMAGTLRAINFKFIHTVHNNESTHPVTREKILKRIRTARFDHVRLSDIELPNDATELRKVGEHIFYVNLIAPDYAARTAVKLQILDRKEVQKKTATSMSADADLDDDDDDF